MAQLDPDVKTRSEKIVEWIDAHPRMGWYLAVWAGLVTLNAVLDLYDKIGHLLQ